MENQTMEQRAAKSWKAMFHTIGQLKLPWLWILFSLAVNLVSNDLLLRLPDTTAELTSGNLSAGAVGQAVVYYILLGIANTASVAVMAQAQAYATRRTRESVWKKMLGLRMEFYDRDDPSCLMSAITNDSNAALSLVNIVVNLVPAVYYVVGAMVRIQEYHWILALSCFLLFPIKYLYALIMGRVFQKSSARVNDRIGALTGFLADRISHLPLVKAFTNEKREREAGESACRQLFKANMRMVRQDNIAIGIVSVIDVLQKFVVIVVAVLLLQRRLIDLAAWLAFFLFTQNLFSYMDSIFDYWTRIKMLQGEFERVNTIMQGEDEDTGAAQPVPEKGDIRLENVRFTYPGTDSPALDNVSLTIPYGSSAAIVGLCGSGKTTSISLIERLYAPDSGRVMIGDVDVSALSLRDYRRKIAYVQQSVSVFGGTVRDSLTYGIERDVSDEELMAAAAKTGFDEYLALCPDGLDTEMASGGASMSGGQGQRLIITRELLRGGDIILMDEPTSALDVRVSAKIQDTMDTLFADKTRILITHDLRFARRYDKIFVLENGRLVGEGSHAELLRSCPVYQAMHENAEMEAKTV